VVGYGGAEGPALRLELPKGPRSRDTNRGRGQHPPSLCQPPPWFQPGALLRAGLFIQPHIFFFAGIITPFSLTMALVPQGGPSNAMSREGSRTALMVQNAAQRDASAASTPELAVGLAPAGTLRLRGAQRDGPHVAWNEDVVDNEGLGRKKSKSTYFNCKNRMAGRYTYM